MKIFLTTMMGATIAFAATPSTRQSEASTHMLRPGPTEKVTEEVVAKARERIMGAPAQAKEIGEAFKRQLEMPGVEHDRDWKLAMARAKWIVGEAGTRTGDPDACRLIREALTMAEAAGGQEAIADAMLSQGSCMHDASKPADALRYYIAAMHLYEQIGNQRSQAITLQYLGMLYEQAADYDRAERYLTQAGAVYDGDPRLGISRESGLGFLEMERKRYEKAAQHYEKARRIAHRNRLWPLEQNVLVNQTAALIKGGKIAEAQRSMAAALRLGTEGARGNAVATSHVTALLLLAEGEVDAAAKKIDSLHPESEAHTSEGVTLHETAYRIYKRARRYEDALRQLEIVSSERERMTALAVSSNTALMATRFDYAGQELRIARLRAEQTKRRYDDQVQSSKRERAYIVIGGCAASLLIAMLAVGLMTLRRSRNRVRTANDELAVANAALELAVVEVRERAEAETQAVMLSERDTLTGLPNRRHLQQRLVQDIETNRSGTHRSVLMIDLDRFKVVNDLNGHQTGDAVLLEVARRLTKTAEGRAAVLRMGGDEFMLITGDIDEEEADGRLATDVIAALGAPYDIGERRHTLGASIGIARHPRDGETMEDLTRAADVAMYEAKRSGRNTHRYYDAELDRRMRRRADLEDALRLAVRDGGIETWFQPIVCLKTGATKGFEALARWNNGEHGMVPPDEFIPIAEEAGLIDGITATVIQQACRAAHDWPDHVSVSVNISPVMLRDRWIVAKTFAILQQERLRPDRLVVEITENAVVDDMDFAREAVQAFRQSGVRVALDDFGKGYSSLSTLRQIPFDHIKLDGSFVHALGDAEALKITTAVAGLARAMGLTATAEGIETEQAAEALRDLGFDCGQGYLYGRLHPRQEAAALALSDDRRHRAA